MYMCWDCMHQPVHGSSPSLQSTCTGVCWLPLGLQLHSACRYTRHAAVVRSAQLSLSGHRLTSLLCCGPICCSCVMAPAQRSASAGSCGQHRSSTTSTRARAMTSLATPTQRSTRLAGLAGSLRLLVACSWCFACLNVAFWTLVAHGDGSLSLGGTVRICCSCPTSCSGQAATWHVS